MTTKNVAVCLFAIIMLPLFLAAQDVELKLNEGLAPLEFMTGSWTTSGENPTESIEYRIVLNGNGIEATHHYQGMLAGIAYYYYDSMISKIRFWYFTGSDVYTEGFAEVVGEEIHLSSYIRGGSLVAATGIASPVNEDSFKATGKVLINNVWQDGPASIYQRTTK